MDDMISAMIQETMALGAYGAGAVAIDKIVFDRGFLSLCESNACGNFGKCWTCPPDVGNIDELIAEAKKFDGVVVYQTVRDLEDSYDFEGMMEAGRLHNELAERITDAFADREFTKTLHLGAGGCRICEVCSKRQEEPCRYPDRAMASLETYGVDVSQLASAAGLKYINGQDTVTFFGAYFYKK